MLRFEDFGHNRLSSELATDFECIRQGKAKRKAWQKVVDEGVTPEEAQKRYVELVNQLLDTYGDKSKDSAE